MKPRRVHVDYLHDILENTYKALDFVKGMTGDDFLQDEKTVFAVIRALEIVGEATKKIPDEIRAKYPDIPWREMAGMRDKMVHDYFGVNLMVVWKTIVEDLPVLKSRIQKAFEKESQDS